MRLGYHELLEALSEPGCAVCRRAEEAVDDVIAGFLHEHVNDPGFRAAQAPKALICRQISQFRGATIGICRQIGRFRHTVRLSGWG
jgi:hypothetical protein